MHMKYYAVLVAMVSLIAIAGLNHTGAAIWNNPYHGPEYTSSGYYGRQKFLLRGATSPEGLEAATYCEQLAELQMRLQCCTESCGTDYYCFMACERLVSQRSYQMDENVHSVTIYDR